MKVSTLIVSLSFFLLACGKGKASNAEEIQPSENSDLQPVVDSCKKCLVMAEQAEGRIIIANTETNKIVWEWKPEISNIQTAHVAWFGNPSDAKIVYGGKYVLMSASKGGIALIRIADKKTVYYANAVGTSNPHSAEILPDGNIVSASSTGSYLAIFKVDTLNVPGTIYKKITLTDAHNVVWDKKEQVLWSASANQLKKYQYNNNCADPGLIEIESITMPASGAHDLFPVYNENALWVTTSNNFYKFDIATKTFTLASTSLQAKIKSVSSGPSGFPNIVLKPKEQWWTDEIFDFSGKSVFYQSGLKIYKSRWVLNNTFSYPENESVKQCQ